MKKLLLCILISISSIVFTSTARAEGIYDGIYSTNPDFGYVTFREQQGTMLAIMNQTLPDLLWSAATGSLNGSSVRVSTIIGDTDVTIDVTFTSPSTFQATQVSCTANPGYRCLFPNGSMFTGKKVW